MFWVCLSLHDAHAVAVGNHGDAAVLGAVDLRAERLEVLNDEAVGGVFRAVGDEGDLRAARRQERRADIDQPSMVGHLEHITGEIALQEQLRLARGLRVAREEEARVAVRQARDQREIVLLVLAVVRLVGGADLERHVAPGDLKRLLGLQDGHAGCGALSQRVGELLVLIAVLFILRHDDLIHRHGLDDLVRAAHVILVKVGDDHHHPHVDYLVLYLRPNS